LQPASYTQPCHANPSFPRIRSIAWNPTGHLIATGSADKILRIWNPDKPQVKNSTELRGHTGAIERVAWNPMKEAELASVSGDGTCKFWDVRSKGCVETVQLGGEGLTISWAADGSAVLVGRKVSWSFGSVGSREACCTLCVRVVRGKSGAVSRWALRGIMANYLFSVWLG
jgi:THO complex subunit 3